MTVDFKLIGARIQATRKAQKITQETLAEALDVSVGYISQIERGITKPNLEMLGAICIHLHCDLAYIVTGTMRGHDTYLEEEWRKSYTQLTHSEKSVVLALMRALLENRS